MLRTIDVSSSSSLTPGPLSDTHSTPWLFIDPLDGLIDPWGSISTTLRTTAIDRRIAKLSGTLTIEILEPWCSSWTWPKSVWHLWEKHKFCILFTTIFIYCISTACYSFTLKPPYKICRTNIWSVREVCHEFHKHSRIRNFLKYRLFLIHHYSFNRNFVSSWAERKNVLFDNKAAGYRWITSCVAVIWQAGCVEVFFSTQKNHINHLFI